VATHYEVLGVGPTASTAEIRQAYLRAALSNHPDRRDVAGPAAAERPARTTEDAIRLRRMQEVNEAWTVLRDPTKRGAYDRELARERRVRAETQRTAQPATAPVAAASGVEDHEVFSSYDVRRVPRVLTLLPPLLIAAAVLLCLAAVALTSQWLVQLGLMILLIGVVLFIVVQLLAMARGGRA
jgi:DnaJ-domain-containing protein 1